MNMLCEECINFFHISIPENSHLTYSVSLCQGCFKKTLVTNPRFQLRLITGKSATCAYPAPLLWEKEALV